MLSPNLAEVEKWLADLYVAAQGTSLRIEDRKKAVEVTALLAEVARVVAKGPKTKPLTLVDAAAGKAYVGLLAAKLVMEPAGRSGKVIALEYEPNRVAAARTAIGRLGSTIAIHCEQEDVKNPSAWPHAPDVVVALHACGPASDAVIDRAVTAEARHILLVPCCTSQSVAAAGLADAAIIACSIPRQAPVRRRFIQAMVDAERTWRLEAAGYQTEVVEFVAPTVTPHNLLWRARRVGEPGRMAAARAAHAAMKR